MTDTQRPRRSPTSEELRIWREFIETVEALSWRLAGRLQSESSLSPGDYQVLLALSEADGHRMRPSELAAAIGWERSRLSHHLGRMEKRDLISRDPCAADGRGAEVVLTRHGQTASAAPRFRICEPCASSSSSAIPGTTRRRGGHREHPPPSSRPERPASGMNSALPAFGRCGSPWPPRSATCSHPQGARGASARPRDFGSYRAA